MDIQAYLPSGEQGILPYYLFIVSFHAPPAVPASNGSQVGAVAVGNSLQNLVTLHYTRRIYNGVFVPNAALSRTSASADFNPDDSVSKLVPASSTGKDVEKARDQVTPLAARLFGVWTLMNGLIRLYTAYEVHSRALYHLSVLTHVAALTHFTSELLVYRTMRLTGPQFFPLLAGWGGAIWMILQYGHYVSK